MVVVVVVRKAEGRIGAREGQRGRLMEREEGDDRGQRQRIRKSSRVNERETKR